METHIAHFGHEGAIRAIAVAISKPTIKFLWLHAQTYWHDPDAAESVFEDDGHPCCRDETGPTTAFADLKSYAASLRTPQPITRYVILWHAGLSKWLGFDLERDDGITLLSAIEEPAPSGNLPAATPPELVQFKEEAAGREKDRAACAVHEAYELAHAPLKKRFASHFDKMGLEPSKTVVELVVPRNGILEVLQVGHWNPHWFECMWCLLNKGPATESGVRAFLKCYGEYLLGKRVLSFHFDNLHAFRLHLTEGDGAEVNYLAVWQPQRESWAGLSFNVGDWDAALMAALKGRDHVDCIRRPTPAEIEEIIRRRPCGPIVWDIEDDLYDVVG